MNTQITKPLRPAAKPGARLLVGLMDDELVATIYGIPL
jgi:hypothetical protein